MLGIGSAPMSAMALSRMGGSHGDSGMTPLTAPSPIAGVTVLDANMVTEYNPNYEFGGICSLQDLKTVSRDRLSLVK
jgi:hypothetical protein